MQERAITDTFVVTQLDNHPDLLNKEVRGMFKSILNSHGYSVTESGPTGLKIDWQKPYTEIESYAPGAIPTASDMLKLLNVGDPVERFLKTHVAKVIANVMFETTVASLPAHTVTDCEHPVFTIPRDEARFYPNHLDLVFDLTLSPLHSELVLEAIKDAGYDIRIVKGAGGLASVVISWT